MINSYINALVAYGLEKGLIEEADRVYCTNGLIMHRSAISSAGSVISPSKRELFPTR